MNQAAFLQIWSQPANSPTIDSSINSSPDSGTLDNRFALQSALDEAAHQLQAHLAHEEGDLYRLEDLQWVLMRWLESSIECLVEDALFHTVEGDRAFAFNRRAFERHLQHLRPLPTQEEIPASPTSTIAA